MKHTFLLLLLFSHCFAELDSLFSDAGFVEAPNLYAFVNNSPPNRLDLFGPSAEEKFSVPHDHFTPIAIHIPIHALPSDNRLIHCKVLELGVQTDYFISCGHWHALQFTPEERKSGFFDPLAHRELMPQAGQINLFSYTHEINNQLADFRLTSQSFIDRLPGTLFIGRYYGTKGFAKDVLEATKEMNGMVNLEILKNQQFLLTISSALEKLNPAVYDSSGTRQSYGALWAHFDHSSGGAIDYLAIEKMTCEQKARLETQLLMTCIAPATPNLKSHGIEAINYFSTNDRVIAPARQTVLSPFSVPVIPGEMFGAE